MIPQSPQFLSLSG